MKTVFIVNSLVIRRRAADWRRIENYARSSQRLACDIWMTDFCGQATPLASEAIRSGYEMVVAVGGDGTVNEVLNGFFEKDVASGHNATFGTIPLGSGCDFARGLGIPRETDEALRTLESGRLRRIDVGRVEFLNFRGERESRFFANIADVGAGGLVNQKASRAPRILGPRPNYVWGILSAALSYKARMVSVSVDGGEPKRLAVRNLVIANGRYFGRGFLPAPHAKIDDGLFDIVNIGNFGTIESVWAIPKLYKGTHLGLKKVSYFRGKTVEVNADEEVLLEMDGELVGTLPATFEIVPEAVNVKGVMI